MSLSRDEVLELLNQKYTFEQIKLAFAEMAKRGYNVDPNDEQFDDDVVETLERLLNAIATGIDEQQKSLPQGEATVENITQSAIALAQSKLARTNTKPELITAVIRSLFQQDIQSVAAIIEARRRAIKVSLQKGEASLLQDIYASSKESADIFTKLANSSEAIDKMLGAYGVDDGATETAAFIQESRDNAVVVRSMVAQWRQEVLARQQESVDVVDEAWNILLAEDIGQSTTQI